MEDVETYALAVPELVREVDLAAVLAEEVVVLIIVIRIVS